MKYWLRYGLLALVMLTLCACASGPKFAEMKDSIPQLQQDAGRVFFYRDASPVGSAVHADIKLDGQVVGRSVPGGFFYTDMPPGNHEVSCKTEAEKKLSFTLDPGQVRYVKTVISMGWLVGRITPELVDEAEGRRAVEGLSYLGQAQAQGQ